MIDHHSPIPPSSAGKVVHCLGYPAMREAVEGIIPDNDKDGEEGECAHWAGELILDAKKRGESLSPYDIIGLQHPNGMFITQEMLFKVMEYTTVINELMLSDGAGPDNMWVEESVQADCIHPLAYGTSDNFIYQPETFTLHCTDLKYGYGIVEAWMNWQLIIYVIGMIQKLHALGKRVERIVLHIVQPRAYHWEGTHRQWELSYEELMQYVPFLKRVYETASKPGALLTSGSHCKNCEAILACPAYRQAAACAIDITEKQWVDVPSNDELSAEIKLLKEAFNRIELRKEALEAVALERLKRGVAVPGYMLGRGRGTRVFNEGHSASSIGLSLGLKLTKEVDLTPTQAELVAVEAKLPKRVITELVHTESGKLTLKPDNSEKMAQAIFK